MLKLLLPAGFLYFFVTFFHRRAVVFRTLCCETGFIMVRLSLYHAPIWFISWHEIGYFGVRNSLFCVSEQIVLFLDFM